MQNGNEWLLLRVYNQNNGNYDLIKIAKTSFYTFFEEFRINKSNNDFNVVELASIDEIEMIRKNKKIYQKNENNYSIKDIDFGCMVFLI